MKAKSKNGRRPRKDHIKGVMFTQARSLRVMHNHWARGCKGVANEVEDEPEDLDEWWRDLQDGKITMDSIGPPLKPRLPITTPVEATAQLIKTFPPIRESVDELRRLLDDVRIDHGDAGPIHNLDGVVKGKGFGSEDAKASMWTESRWGHVKRTEIIAGATAVIMRPETPMWDSVI